MAEVAYKVLVADDEYWTREKLRTMLDWKQYNIDFLEPAVDGEDVLNKIKENMPDILITDINMPFIDGVELVKLLKEKYPEIVVFVISGYDDFDFVKNTLLSGAINYMLKPVTKIDLVNTISKALEIISNRKKEKQEQEDLRLQILKSSSMISDREFSLLVEKEEAIYTPTVMMNSNMDFAGSSLMLIKIHNLSELSQEYHRDMNLLSYTIKKEIKEITGYEDLLIFNYIFRSNEFIIITELDKMKLNRMAQIILKYFTGKTKSPISIIISEHSYSIESIHTAYIQSVSMLMTRKFKESNAILFCDNNNPELRKNVTNHITEEHEFQLKHLLKSRNQAGISRLVFDTIGLKNCDVNGWSFLEVKQTTKKICNILIDYISNYKTHQEMVEIENLNELAEKTVESMRVENLCFVINEMIEFAMDMAKEEASGSIRDVVKQAVKYIDENYFEELTLLSLSQKYNVESSYFSKIFRQETGDNLMLYIAKKRIDKSKEHMIDPKISLTEIAFMVGYDEYTYFNRVFRKITGVSPSEYRNELMKQ